MPIFNDHSFWTDFVVFTDYAYLFLMIKAANKVLKANKCTYTVNKASVMECQAAVKLTGRKNFTGTVIVKVTK